jgi:hypothetical protein
MCRAIVTFGVNALYGRYNVRRSIWAGKWNSTNAYDFVKYTISKGYPVGSWEFGKTIFLLLKHSVSFLIFQDRSSPSL